MNFKRQAQQLEKFLEEELATKPPIFSLKDGSIVYKDFVVKKNKQDKWTVKRYGGQVLDTFNLKSCAVTGAKLYSTSNFRKYGEIKVLDDMYFKNNTDAQIFKYKYEQTKDTQLKDLYIARYTEARLRANYAKSQIVGSFKTFF